ncbi:hypothetical protein HPQ64_10485 [Rhizobiales bacterium]|uniref:hypothetical protein n=1 Tax=Hongsoonwoonella zoysiae TaxID=2821844 RepID=UPI00155FD688|nr:hypothetical protein [Hongsoonwoonella zoysiae]NRG18116.1 hypothetical protein [Hongsoonwoonella zoysiae]
MASVTLPRSAGSLSGRFTGVVIALAMVGTVAILLKIGAWLDYSGVTSTWTQNQRAITINLAGQRLEIPANMIRERAQRQTAIKLESIELAVVWPEMTGYEARLASAFTDTGVTSPRVLISLQADRRTAGTYQRLETVYRLLASGPATEGEDGLSRLPLSQAESDASDFIAYSPPEEAFAARCFVPADTRLSAECRREFRVGPDLMASYRFRPVHLKDWRVLDRSIAALVASFRKQQ